jgi:hypothetical protein
VKIAELEKQHRRLLRLYSRQLAALSPKDLQIAQQAGIISGLQGEVTALEAIIAAGGGGSSDPELIEQIADLQAANATLVDRQMRVIASFVETAWEWNGALTAGGSTSDWQAGKPTTIQHDAAAPGLTVVTMSGEPALQCSISSTQANVAGSNKRAEITLSAIGSPGDIQEGDIFQQECELFIPSGIPWFPTASASDWAVMGQQKHQNLPLGNGGPDQAMELHQSRYRQRTVNGFFDKAVNSTKWASYYGLSGDGGVLWTGNAGQAGGDVPRDTWMPLKWKGRASAVFPAGWMEFYMNNVQKTLPKGLARFPIATMDFDGDPAQPANGTAPTYTTAGSYLKWGFYQKFNIGPRTIYVRRQKARKWRPVYA